MHLCRFNEIGLQEFHAFLDALSDGCEPDAAALLLDKKATERMLPFLDVEQRTFRDRFDLAAYLNTLFASSKGRDVERDKGLWSWLSLFFLEQLCPPDK